MDLKKEERALIEKRYRVAIELVEQLKQYGLWIRIVCPKCGSEGTLSTLTTPNGYTYLVVRHINKNTHTVPRSRVGEVLCKVERNLAHILVIYKEHEDVAGVKLCTDAGKST